MKWLCVAVVLGAVAYVYYRRELTRRAQMRHDLKWFEERYREGEP